MIDNDNDDNDRSGEWILFLVKSQKKKKTFQSNRNMAR